MMAAARRAVIVIAAVAACGAAAGTAAAGQLVVAQNGNLVAMNDDGTGAHVLATPSQLTGIASIDGAGVQPNGTRIAFTGEWSGAQAEMNRWSPPALGACGLGCIGTYRLDGGTAERLTEAPSSCASDAPCYGDEVGPQVATNGDIFVNRTVTDYFYGSCGGWCVDAESDSIEQYPGATTPGIAIPTPCSDGGTRWSKFVAVDPTNAKHILYSNCTDTDNMDFVLIDGGSNLTTTDDDTILDEDPNPIFYPAFSSDGHDIAEIKDTPPGIWVSKSKGAFTELIALGANDDFGEVRFLPNGRIGFVDNGVLYSISATCTTATCTFPGSATAIASGVGDEWGWTVSSATISPLKTTPAPTNPGPGSGTGTGTTPGGSGTGTKPGGSRTGGGSSQPIRITAASLKPSRFAVRHGKRGGSTLSVTVTGRGFVTLSMARRVRGVMKGSGRRAVCGPGPKHPKAGQKRCSYLLAMAHMTLHFVAGVNHFAFTGKISAIPLPAGTYRMTLTVNGGKSTRTLSFTVLRSS